jgi:Putative zinc-finger
VKANYQYFQELVPLYALDLLDLEEQLWVKAQIEACPDLAQELANYQIAVCLMFYSVPTVAIAADLKRRLFNRLNLDPVLLPLQS